ncbi:hypothetical protein TSH7_24185 [Azospirillum sp. TSH7]|uniref:SPASM domain-containing protein n=1 Tax=unclassified Azospirillum TaxID=2630922 RepID=UPI000D621033|nr:MULTISPECIES: SPASM domain-containing protein [unclassified Azospirillum]PWC58192.1 hypothetical protein TSH7_24185 [Azospirillum sp. TSH7]PWC71098.1 hypothetical protein TSH20_04675 [Azospirillum sp. TSH20]
MTEIDTIRDLPEGMTRFCLDPWQYVEFQTNGAVTPCCNRPAIGTLGTQSLEDILNGEAARRLRADLLNGKPDQHCRRCHIRAPAQPNELHQSIAELLAHAK